MPFTARARATHSPRKTPAGVGVNGAHVGHDSVWSAAQTGSLRFDDPYLHFPRAVTKADAASHAELVASWHATAHNDWRAAAQLLARRYPDEWAGKTRHEVTATVVTVDAPSAESIIRERLDRLGSARPPVIGIPD